ncbi:MAG: DUF1987 domain-containing protein [Bacillota bacterium]
MNRLLIEQAKATPKVDFDPNSCVLRIEGQSYPENSFKFYEPVFAWVDEYLANSKAPLTVNITLSYLNTSSSKCMLMLLDKLEDAFRDGQAVVLNWSCDADNESEWECAEEFKEEVTFPFNIIPLTEEC